MFFGAPGPAEMLVVLAMLGGGAGLPLGVPPAAEDPMMAQVAPEECIFYLTWSGVAEPDPDSTNQTEQLLAEPEVRQMIDEIVRRIKTGLRDAAKKEDPDAVPVIEDVSNWVQTLLTHPTAMFVSKFEMSDEGPPVIRGGAVVAVGDGTAELKTKLKAYQQKFLPPSAAKEVQIGGDTWYRLKLDPDAPEITWGTKGKYLIVGVGEGAVEAILEQAATPPPKWLVDLRKQLPVDRVSTVSYVNVKTLIGIFSKMFNRPQAGVAFDTSAKGCLRGLRGGRRDLVLVGHRSGREGVRQPDAGGPCRRTSRAAGVPGCQAALGRRSETDPSRLDDRHGRPSRPWHHLREYLVDGQKGPATGTRGDAGGDRRG